MRHKTGGRKSWVLICRSAVNSSPMFVETSPWEATDVDGNGFEEGECAALLNVALIVERGPKLSAASGHVEGDNYGTASCS